MAKIVFAAATSHGPQLHTPPDQWGLRVVADKQKTDHPFRGNYYSFDELVALRRDENLAAQITPDVWKAKFERNRVAMEEMRRAYEAAKPDVAIIFGNDQQEMYLPDNQPAIAVYAGDTIENSPMTEEDKAQLPPGIAIAEPGHAPEVALTHDCHPELARRIIADMSGNDIDVAMSTIQPRGKLQSAGASHAFGFVYRNIMSDNVIPHVPIVLNTFWKPNQPRDRRCYEVGKVVRRTLDAWDSDARVAVFGSGGMTHFIIDEAFDKLVISSLTSGDVDELLTTPESIYQAGTSELKTWVALAGCIGGLDLTPRTLDYVPCYRSEAGPGTAQGFVVWS